MTDEAYAALVAGQAATNQEKGETMSFNLTEESNRLLDAAYQSQGKAKEAQGALQSAQSTLDDANRSIEDARKANTEAASQARQDAQAAIASISNELGLTMSPASSPAQANQGRQAPPMRRV